MFWNPLIISFPIGTETLWLAPKMMEKIGFKEYWGHCHYFIMQVESFIFIFSVFFCDNHKVSVLIGKLMIRGSKTPLTFKYYSKLKVLWPSKTKPIILCDTLWKKVVIDMISVCKLKSFISIFSAPFGPNRKISVPIIMRIS